MDSAMKTLRAPRGRRSAGAGLLGLLLLSIASAASAKPLPPAIAVHVPSSVTLRSMDGVQSELIDIRAKLQRSRAEGLKRGYGRGL
jgi:hypothetical protein